MHINMTIDNKISSFYLFFIITGIQIGVGIMGVPRFIFKEAHQDAWLSILVTFVWMLIVIQVMLMILKQYENADLFGIQVDVFGKFIGKLFGTIYILFYCISLVTVYLNYIEVVHVFLYPTLSPFVMAILLAILALYTVMGGFHVAVGISFIFFFLPQWLWFLLYDPISRMDFDHFLPMFDASFTQILKGAKVTTYSVIGFEILFFIYPYISNKKNIRRSAFWAVAFSSFVVLSFTIISIGYFSPHDLSDVNWSVITLFKSVSFSFIERLDYIVVVEWMMIVLPNLVLLLWIISQGLKRIYHVPPKYSLYIISAICVLLASIIKKYDTIHFITNFIANFGFWLVFIYPFFLLVFMWLKKILFRKGA